MAASGGEAQDARRKNDNAPTEARACRVDRLSDYASFRLRRPRGQSSAGRRDHRLLTFYWAIAAQGAALQSSS